MKRGNSRDSTGFIGVRSGIFDLSLGIAAQDGSYSAQVYVLNLFDSFYEASLTGQSVIGIEAAHGLPYKYTPCPSNLSFITLF